MRFIANKAEDALLNDFQQVVCCFFNPGCSSSDGMQDTRTVCYDLKLNAIGDVHNEF